MVKITNLTLKETIFVLMYCNALKFAQTIKIPISNNFHELTIYSKKYSFFILQKTNQYDIM